MRATEWNAAGELDKARHRRRPRAVRGSDSALAQKLIHRNRDAIMAVFQSFLGDLERQPQLARPLHELGAARRSARARRSCLSRIDGMLSIDEILDVVGHAAARGVSSPVPAVPARHPARMSVRRAMSDIPQGRARVLGRPRHLRRRALDRRDLPLRGRRASAPTSARTRTSRRARKKALAVGAQQGGRARPARRVRARLRVARAARRRALRRPVPARHVARAAVHRHAA